MSKIQNDKGRSSVEEFAKDELSGAASSSIRSRAQAARRNRLFNANPAPSSLSDKELTGGDGNDSSIASFKFLECDPISINEPEPPECPFCVKDPTAYVPDYTLMYPGEVFYDAKECTYSVVLEVAPPNEGGPSPTQLDSDKNIIDEVKKLGIKKLLEAYNKSETAVVYYYEQEATGVQDLAAVVGATAAIVSIYATPSAGAAVLAAGATLAALIPDQVPGYLLVAEQRDVVTELLPYTTYNYTFPIQLKARTKIKVSINSEVFFRAPQNAITDPSTEFEASGFEVSIPGNQWFPMFRHVVFAMWTYNNQFVRWQKFDGGILEKVEDDKMFLLDIEEEREALKFFRDNVADMLISAGFKRIRDLEKITLKFEPVEGTVNPKIKLKQVITNKLGCPEIIFDQETEETKYLFDKLLRYPSTKRNTTLYYVGALPEMELSATAREPTPWLDFILKYTYPSLKVSYGEDSSALYNDPSLGECFANSIASGDGALEDLANATIEELLSLPDSFLEEFNETMCMTPKELDDLKAKRAENTVKKNAERAYETGKKGITKGDPYLERVFQNMEQSKVGQRLGFKPVSADEQIRDVNNNVIDKLGYCGWIALIMKALDCVAQGLGEEDFKGAMVEAAIGAMDPAVFQRMTLGLPPEVKAQLINDISDDFKGLPAPWDLNSYQVGSYTGAEFTENMTYSETEKMENDDYKKAKDSFEAAKEGYNNLDSATVESLSAALEKLLKVNKKEFPGTIVSGVQDTSGGFLGIGFDGEDFSFGEQSKGSGGTYATVLGNSQQAIFDAYANQILKTVGVDDLFNHLGNLPGAPIIVNFLQAIPCKPTPPWAFDPKLSSFMNTLEFDFCQVENNELTLPKFSGALKIGWGNLFKALKMAGEEALKQMVIAVVMQGIKSLLQWVTNLGCDTAALLGANLLDLFDGSDHFKELLASNLCPDQDPEEVNAALGDLFSAIASPDYSCLSDLTAEEIGDFIDDLSLMLTQDQICALLKGNADSSIISLVAEVARASDSLCIREVFSDELMIAKLFSSLGKLMPDLDSICAESAGNFPATVCPPDVLASIEDLKCQLLSQKGLTPAECRSELDKLKDALKDAAASLGDLMQNGPYGGAPALVGSGCTEGVFAENNPMLAEVMGAVSNLILAPIETNVVRDMFNNVNPFTGVGGFMNVALSDTKGRPWKTHNFTVKYFGAPYAEDQGVLEFASDNAIRNPFEKPGFDVSLSRPNIQYLPHPLDVNGNEVDPKNFLDVSEGGFPPTVAAWLAKQYREMDPVFKTVTVPVGYNSVEEAIADVNKKQEINDTNIGSRKLYIEQYIKENKLDKNKSSHDEIELAGMLRKKFSSSKLFLPGNVYEDYYEAEERLGGNDKPKSETRKVLMGEAVKGFGRWDSMNIKDGKGAHPRDWDEDRQEKAGTNGLSWVDWAEANLENGAALLEVPDVVTGDVEFKYTGYEGEDSIKYKISYDYNLLDENNNLLRGGDYNIRIEQTNPTDSTLDESVTTIRTHDLMVTSQITTKIQDFIDDLPLSDSVDDSWQMETFYRTITQEIINKSSTPEEAIAILNNKEVRDYFTGAQPTSKYDEISSGFIKRIANRIAVGKSYPAPAVNLEDPSADDFLSSPAPEESSEELSQEETVLRFISPAFRFGYDPEKRPEIIPLDNETYGGVLGQLFPDLIPAPFYVQPPDYTGWLDLVEVLMPDQNECTDSGTMFFDLSDLKDLASEVSNQLIEDPRTNFDPLCSEEAPYDKIFTPMVHGNLEMIMRAAARVQISANFMFAIPVISQFAINKDNYDDGIFDYITASMVDGLKEAGRTFFGKSSNEYYYQFLEQAVNVTARKVQSGALDLDEDLTEEERVAFDIIAARVLSFYEENSGKLAALSTTAIEQQNFIRRGLSSDAKSAVAGLGAGSADFSKASAKNAKKQAFEIMIEETEEQALVFVKKIIREEFLKMGEIFNSRLLPTIQNVDHLFLLSDTWIRGAVNPDGPLDVMSNPNDPSKYNVPTGQPGTLIGAVADLEAIGATVFGKSIQKAFAEMDEWPFVLERYVRIIEKDVPVSPSRAENLYGVVNLQDWDAFIKSKPVDTSGLIDSELEDSALISDYWGKNELQSKTELANEHAHEYNIDGDGNGTTKIHYNEDGEGHMHNIVAGKLQEAGANPHVHELDFSAWKFGLRISYMPDLDSNNVFTEAMNTISPEVVMSEKSFKMQSPEGVRYSIPIASAELAIPDQDFSLFDPESYDIYCLIPELIDTPEYQTMFRYVFPLSRYVSVLAIYNMTCFVDSIGNTGMPEDGGDMWENPGGNRFRGFGNWDRTEMFDKSRKAARDAFRSMYRTANPGFDPPPDQQGQAMSFLELLKPMVNFEDGLKWWQRGRRIKKKPTELCD